jgi:hypothetical protein
MLNISPLDRLLYGISPALTCSHKIVNVLGKRFLALQQRRFDYCQPACRDRILAAEVKLSLAKRQNTTIKSPASKVRTHQGEFSTEPDKIPYLNVM